MTYKIQSLCRLCASSRLTDFFNLGSQSLSGCFPGPKQDDPPHSPLVLCRCENCQLVQLRHSTDPEKMFTDHYGYQSSLNSSMKDHLHELQSWISARIPVKPGDRVLDIGANDGTLLEAWQGKGIKRIAVDPILSKFAHLYPDDIEQIQGFFSLELVQRQLVDKPANIITSISMFYDLPDLNNFVAGIALALAKDGVWVLEQSYLPAMLANNSFDTVCHEHLEYYSLAQIDWLARSHGLKILDVSTNYCNGGSFRVALGRENCDLPRNIPAIQTMKAAEEELALYTPVPYAAFTKRIEALREATRTLLGQLKNQGKTVWIYGASTKGNVLLQHYGIDCDLVTGAVEVNPEKFGHRTPGTNIPIRAEADILQESPDYFFVLPWHFRENILTRGQNYLDAGVKFIFPLPNLEIIGSKGLE
jgi:NDP-4-keto-2,6-dideoxyhexose 3-C-methyltransferase